MRYVEIFIHSNTFRQSLQLSRADTNYPKKLTKADYPIRPYG